VIAASDLISVRNNPKPTHITVHSLKGNYIVNRAPEVLENDPGRLVVQTSSKDTAAILTTLHKDLPVVSYPVLFYGNSTGYKGVREFSGQMLSRVIAPWFPPNDYQTVQTGMLSIAGVDGFRAAFSVSEIVNRNDHKEILLRQDGVSFAIYTACDAFADRSIKGLSEIRLIEPQP
jgi:hypothetical protein